uniref:hypothetical protein n=1 Tax=Wolbachia endosymbiont of Chironomus riparius TaxID=2883238 RepID=UPI0020A199CB|nr:hypothetical protein [Wolbachia endosymbiont of Chironomus riparius]
MGKTFSINTDESFFYTLVEHILSSYKETELPELKIILPYKSDILALLNAFKNYNTKKCIILPEIVSLENIDEEDLILNLDEVKVINPIKRILLLIKFILKWNEENNDNFSIDLAYDLASLLNTIQIFNVTDNSGDYSRKTDNFIDLLRKNWSKTLKEIGVIDILEHKNNYINNMIVSLKENQHIIFVGIGRNENCKSLIKRIYNLPNGQIILPNLNFKIREKDWQKLDKKHYQYCLKNLLSDLKISRNDVHSLSKKSDQIIDEIFDTTSDLSKVKNQNNCSNIEIIICDSVEEEAQVISLITRNEGLKDVSLFTNNQLLATRVECLLKQGNIENYQYIMLLLYSINTLTSNWNSIELLSLLKHPLITFNYTKEKYNKIISEFEIEILRNFNVNDLKKIIYMINKNKKIKYKEDIIYIINTLQAIFNPLIHIINHSIYKIAITHLKCIEMLSGSHLSNEVRNYMSNFINACEDVNFRCSLDLYSKILTLFLKRIFSPR